LFSTKEISMHVIQWSRCPVIARHDHARRWLQSVADLGHARNTVEAYGRALEEYLSFTDGLGVAVAEARRDHVAAYVRTLLMKNKPDGKVVEIDAPMGLSNATVQQRLTAIRLFYDFLMEEQQCNANPVGRGRFTPGRVFGGQRDRGLVPRVRKLPWIPSDDDWLALVQAVRLGSARDRFMVALAYDAALRREELCLLATTDIDPAHRVLRVRAETTKNQRERILPFSTHTGTLYQQYLADRREIGNIRGPLFLSASNRNRAQPLSIWTWSKTVKAFAMKAQLPRFSTHTFRHLRLTDLARADWDIHEIATFAGHRNVETTMMYIHLTGSELAKRLEQASTKFHELRIGPLAEARP
jgi:site-specific recombinase XerD